MAVLSRTVSNHQAVGFFEAFLSMGEVLNSFVPCLVGLTLVGRERIPAGAKATASPSQE